MKKYKDLNPIETINNVRSSLFKMNILLKEHQHMNNGFYSCRINMANNELNSLDLGTNGKGSTMEYSLASGYAEFMERLQNKMLFNNMFFATKTFVSTLPIESSFRSKLEKEKLTLDYLFDKNEEIWTLEKVINHCSEELLLLLNLDNKDDLSDYIKEKLGYENIIMVPFYSVSDQKSVFLPIEVLLSTTGSNGMAAGNSFKEAFLQGFCEIFERYAIAEIYYKNITPPTIPLDHFKDTNIYDKINRLIEENDYEVIIKDCSLNKGIPVIGAIIIDTKSKLYNFKLGADFIPERALERCFTEFHQSSSNFHGVELELAIFEKTDIIDDFKYHNCMKILTDGYGHWPCSIFSDNFTYEFNGFNTNYGESDEYDIKKSIEIVKDMGYKVFVRDNSILGFPTYYTVIPGLSQLSKDKSNIKQFKKNIFNLNKISKLDAITKNEAKLLSQSIDDNYKLMKFYNYNYTQRYLYNISSDLIKLDLELLQFMLYFYIGDAIKAKEYLDVFLYEKDKYTFSYYFAISDFIHLYYINNQKVDDVLSILEKCYGKDVSNDVFHDLENPDNIFQYHSFPICFECDKCKLTSTCSFFSAVEIEKKINEYGNKNYIKQENMKFKLSEIIC